MISGVVAVMLFGIPAYAEDAFKSSDFLTWDKPSQDLLIESSIRMAGIIMSFNSAEQSQCLENWLQGDKEQRYTSIRQTMSEYPDHNPQGIILAYIEKQCGSVTYQKR